MATLPSSSTARLARLGLAAFMTSPNRSLHQSIPRAALSERAGAAAMVSKPCSGVFGANFNCCRAYSSFSQDTKDDGVELQKVSFEDIDTFVDFVFDKVDPSSISFSYTDDGLELQKVSFESIDTFLDCVFDKADPSSFSLPYLKSGLDDSYNVKMQCHLNLVKLAKKCPSAVLAVLDSLVDPLQKTINFRPKQDAGKQEVDRNEDMIRSALRAIASLDRIGGRDYSPKFKSLMDEMAESQPLWDMYCSIKNE